MIFIKIDQSLLNGHYWSTQNVPNLKFLKNISSSKKELSMEIYVESLKGQYFSILICYKDWNVCYIYLLSIKIDQCFLNRWYRSNHIVCDSNLLETWNWKKTWAFNENLIESLKRKIMVKLCCAWYNFSINFQHQKIYLH